MPMKFWPGWIFIGPNLYLRTCAPGGGAGSLTGMFVGAARNADAWASKARCAGVSASAVGAVESAASRAAAAMAHRWEGAIGVQVIGSGVQQQVGSPMEHHVCSQVTA